ncbi:MAG: hypothetical protein IJW14_04560 [Oscillospiraceae bacterium]|nr:hypothetical protein [Oscillospiraceae bacterium]
MDTLFECSYLHTAEMDQEFYRYWFFKRPLMVALYVLLLLGFLCGVLDYFLYFNFDVTLFLPPVAFGLMYLTYRSNTDASQKRNLEVANGENLEIRILLTSEKVLYETSVSGRTRELPLNGIKKVIDLSSQIVLVSDAKMLYSFRKDSFTKGSAAEMVQFLKQKGLLH